MSDHDREVWLEGYRFALANLNQSGVLADAHRYQCEAETGSPCRHMDVLQNND